MESVASFWIFSFVNLYAFCSFNYACAGGNNFTYISFVKLEMKGTGVLHRARGKWFLPLILWQLASRVNTSAVRSDNRSAWDTGKVAVYIKHMPCLKQHRWIQVSSQLGSHLETFAKWSTAVLSMLFLQDAQLTCGHVQIMHNSTHFSTYIANAHVAQNFVWLFHWDILLPCPLTDAVGALSRIRDDWNADVRASLMKICPPGRQGKRRKFKTVILNWCYPETNQIANRLISF